MSEALKPDIKKAGLKVAEKTAMEVMEEIVKPYAKYYSAKTGLSLDGFIDDLIKKIENDFVDKIDGEDNFPG